MKHLTNQRSAIGKRIGDEFDRVWDAIRSLQPVDGPQLRADHSQSGINWRLRSSFIARLTSATIHKAQITTVGEKQLTCTDLETSETITVERPDALRSYASTRLTASDPDNWLPADGDTSSSGPSFNYLNVNYRMRIVHVSDPDIEYCRHLERITPMYSANDFVFAFKDGETWEDLNVDGRSWRQIFQYDLTPIPALSAVPAFTTQDSDQNYSNNSPGWLPATDYSAFDQY